MSYRIPLAALAVGAVLAATACSGDRATPTAPATDNPAAGALAGEAVPGEAVPGEAAPGGTTRRAALEHLAWRLAVALGDPEFRADYKRQLDRSPFREHKLHFQQLVGGDRRALALLARAGGEAEARVLAELGKVGPLESYLPVPAHRSAWHGGADVLVATAIRDHDAPIAFDLHGRRRVLSPDHPPAIPVIALVPAAQRFAGPGDPAAMTCQESCGGGGGGGGGGSTTVTPGLYLTKSHLRDTFEGWLKGSPEIEILVLGQKGATDSLTKYQCSGERAAGPYYFDQNDKDWTGSTLLFSQTQLDNFKAQHPGQATRLFFMEDDDTACELRNDNGSIAKLIGDVDAATRGLSGGRDSTTGTLQKAYRYFNVAQKIYSVVASFINSNDDMIGNAVEDVTTTEQYPGYNWIVKGDNNQTNGYIYLQMR